MSDREKKEGTHALVCAEQDFLKPRFLKLWLIWYKNILLAITHLKLPLKCAKYLGIRKTNTEN